MVTFLGGKDKSTIATSTNPIPTEISSNGNSITVQNPFPTDGDSVYAKDVWVDESVFTNWSGVITDLFDNLHSQTTNVTSTDPKIITIHFNRPVVSSSLALGCTGGGNFSNVVIKLVGSGSSSFTVIDQSLNNTKYTSRAFLFPVIMGFNAITIEFHTSDVVTLSNCSIGKSVQVISRLQAVKPDNTVTDINATAGGNLKVSVEETEPGANSPFYLEVAKGNISGYSTMSKFGQNSSLTTSYQDICDAGGTYVYPANGTAPITNVESTNASDVTDLEVQGLDINGALVVQTITLTGTTLVTLPTPLWRVFRLKNVGSVDYVGIVTADNAATTINYAIIQIGNNQTLMALYTIPLGKTGYLLQGTNSLVTTNRAYSVSGRMTMRPHGGVFQLKKTFGLESDGTSYMLMPYPLPAKIPALTDIRVSAKSSATGGLNTTFEILLIDN